MQAVILAAGKSTRTYPLTLTRPKPMLKVANKTLLEHNLDNLNGVVDEVIVVVGYKKNLIKNYLGNKYKGLRIRYVEQRKQLGTAHAVSVVEHYIKDRFILLMGDDIYSKEDVKNCVKHRYTVLTTNVKDQLNASERIPARELARRARKQLTNFGVVVEKNNILLNFIEKPRKFVSNLVSTAFYVLDKKIFQYIKKIKKSERKEFELPDAIKLMSKDEKIHIIKSKKWFPIVYAWDLLRTDRKLRNNKNVIGKNSKIYKTVKNSSIGNDCIIKGHIENSIIMDKTIIEENSIVKNSIIGKNSCINGKISNSIIADNVKSRNAIVKNCRIWPNKIISNRLVQKDVA